MNCNKHRYPVARALLGLAWACLASANAQGAADSSSASDQALQQRMNLCQSRLEGFEQRMIDRIAQVESDFGDELRRRPQLEQMEREALRVLEDAKARYGYPPTRPEHRLYFQGLEQEHSNIQRSLAIARHAERGIAIIKPFLSTARARKQANFTLLDDFGYALEDCASRPGEQAECHAQALQPLRKPLRDALDASQRLLYDAWPPLRAEDVRYPSDWENDCAFLLGSD
ncbi:hypothetical protein [Pseudomonas sp. UFMG81]|uniref:hypothetical protein n=1 Tax=Pseudomonas sp. UFMG81 TaxID=2745936 RepID=UPI00188E966A|nr:hypothetical protein [Pseudomonas sp. UFMG81]